MTGDQQHSAESVAIEWPEAVFEVDYEWYRFCHATTPLDQAQALVRLQDAMSDLRTFLPGYDYGTGMLPWERDDEEVAHIDGSREAT